MQDLAEQDSCQLCDAEAKYPLKDVEAAMQAARVGHGQGKILLEG
jgi:hypothetical protein